VDGFAVGQGAKYSCAQCHEPRYGVRYRAAKTQGSEIHASASAMASPISLAVCEYSYVDFRNNGFRVDSSSTRVDWDPLEDVPENLRAMCARTMRAVGTKGDGACAVHAVFGAPAALGLHVKTGARDVVRRVLGSCIQSLLNRGAGEAHVQALWTSFWVDLTLVYLKRTAEDQRLINDEPKLFWESLAQHVPQVAKDAKLHFERQRVMRQQSDAF
jgi:hypothetical protein